jgi:hypothetical protein
MLTIAFAIALGWSLYQLAHAVAAFIDGLTVHLPPRDASGFGGEFTTGSGLAWIVGRHVVSLDGMLMGLLQVVIVLAIAAYVRSRVSD